MSTLPTVEQAMKAAADADALVASDLGGMVHTCAQVAIDELATTGDPCWAEAAASLVKALFEIGLAGRPVEADEAEAGEEAEPGPTPETKFEERHPRPWRVETGGDLVPRVCDRDGRQVAVGLEEEKLAYVAAYNREPLLREVAEAARKAVGGWHMGAVPDHGMNNLENLLHRLRLADGGG